MSDMQMASRVEPNRPGRLLAARLSTVAALTAADREALSGLPYTNRQFRRDNAIALAGSAPGDLAMITEGFGARLKITRWGDHPIVGFLLPGDVFDWPLLMLKLLAGETQRMVLDHSVIAVSSCNIAVFRAQTIADLIEVYPNIARAFESAAFIDQNITREWLANIGGRPAAERTAHVLCEHFHRMQAIGLTHDRYCHFPYTQSRLSASQGLSVVHTNRVLKRLHEENLLCINGRTLEMIDQPRVEAFADFSRTYLGLDRMEELR